MSARELARVTLGDDGYALKEIIVREVPRGEYHGPSIEVAWRITSDGDFAETIHGTFDPEDFAAVAQAIAQAARALEGGA